MLFRITLSILVAGSCLAQNAARMDQIVQSYLSDHKFMGSVLVAQGDQVIFNKTVLLQTGCVDLLR